MGKNCKEKRLIKSLRSENTNKVNIQPIRLNEWQRHYTKELKGDREEYLTNSPKPYEVQGHYTEINEETIEKALKSMENKRAPGPEGLPAELLTNGSPKLVKYLKGLVKRLQ